MRRVQSLSADGFTLVEMAVVLVVMGIVMLTIFPALTALRNGSQRSLTQANLQALMQATAVYVQANGCLPCPTPAAIAGNGFGRIRGDASASPVACNGCPTPEGIPPFMSLGLPAGTAHDGGGHWISMRVDPALTVTSLGTVIPPTKPIACSCAAPVNGVCIASPVNCTCSTPVNNVCTPLPAGLSQQGLCTSGLTATNRISVLTPNGASQQAAVIFVSHGIHGYGSFVADAKFSINGTNGARLPFPSPVSCSSSGGYAECNADGNAQYVNAPAVAAGTDTYDDMLAFADRNTLVGMFSNGSCQTVW